VPQHIKVVDAARPGQHPREGPGAGEAVVGAPADQQRVGPHRLLELELVAVRVIGGAMTRCRFQPACGGRQTMVS
jgi:hypothetical protein